MRAITRVRMKERKKESRSRCRKSKKGEGIVQLFRTANAKASLTHNLGKKKIRISGILQQQLYIANSRKKLCVITGILFVREEWKLNWYLGKQQNHILNRKIREYIFLQSHLTKGYGNDESPFQRENIYPR